MRPRASSQDGWPCWQGAVGFDEAAVGGLTAAVLLELALEFLQRGRRIRFTSSLGWWLAVGGASVLGVGSGFAPTHRGPGWGTLGEREASAGITARPGQGGRAVLAAHRGWSFSGSWCWPGSVSSSAQGGHSQRTTSALGCCRIGPTWASTSALVEVGLPHSGQGRGADLAGITVGHRLGLGSGRRWS
jgi:hypothetical protein